MTQPGSQTTEVTAADNAIAQTESDMDSMHILPLSIIPLETPSLKRARLIKNIRLESVVELFNAADTGSGQIPVAELGLAMDWSKDEEHPDEAILNALSNLHSYDVYSLRIQLRKLNITCEDPNALKLSDSKHGELMRFMNDFTQPLLRQIYDTGDSGVQSMDQLISQFSSPNQEEALRNLKLMADKLQIKLQEVPQFLEKYADIYLSIAYGRDCLDTLIPRIVAYGEAMQEFRDNYELSKDKRLMRSIDFINGTLSDVTASVVGRFESFDRASETMWDNITTDSFAKVKKMVRGHHVLVGTILCSLNVKMNGWQEVVAAGSGLLRRADFVRSDMMQGMEKISKIEQTVQEEQRQTPAWESFTTKDSE